MQAVIFFAFFLLVDLFGLADFVVFQAFQIHRTSSIHVRITECCTPNQTWKTKGAPLFRFGFRFAGLKPWFKLYGKASILVRIAGCWYSSYILLSSRNLKTNWCLFRIYGVRFGEKDRGLSTCKPWSEQAGGLDSILHEAAQDFEIF